MVLFPSSSGILRTGKVRTFAFPVHGHALVFRAAIPRLPIRILRMVTDDTEAILKRLTGCLDLSIRLRAAAKADVKAAKYRQDLRAWQAARLARTHADLLASPRFGRAAAFFLADIYSDRDVGGRDEQVKQAVPAMSKFLSVSALETATDAIELDALTEDLDAAMIAVLGPQTAALDVGAYGRAYREVDRRRDRERQIHLIEHLGQTLDRLANRRFAGPALVLLRKPAQLAGFGDLLAFLERGYDAVHGMGSVEEFLNLVVSREKRVLEAVFAGDDSVLGKGQ